MHGVKKKRRTSMEYVTHADLQLLIAVGALYVAIRNGKK
jgi:hypothetical protein